MRRIIEYFEKNFFAEHERRIAWLPVLFGCGIGFYFLLGQEPSKWLSVICFELLLVWIYCWRYQPQRWLLPIALIVIVLGFCDIQLRSLYQQKFIENPNGNDITYLQGRIVRADKNAKGKARLLLADVSDFENSRRGLFRVTLSGKDNPFTEGQCVEMIATLMRPSMPAYPGGYQFDRKAYFEGISAVGYANSPVYAVECQTEPPLLQKLSLTVNLMRRKIVERINRELPPDEAGIAAAIVAGDRSGISEQITDNYRDSGLAHFLSISGLHMSMIAAMAFFIVRLLVAMIPFLALRFNAKKAAAVFAIVMSFFYLLISGAGIPAQRAFVTTFVVLLGVLFDRQAISMRMVSIAAFVVLIISPQALIGASFQMSFAAVVVLVAFYERYAATLHRFFAGRGIVRVVLAYAAGILVTDFVASIATLPFAIYHFNRIAVYTSLGNFLAGPIIGLVIMPFVLLSLLLMPLGLAGLTLKIVGFGVMLVNKITAMVAGLPGAGYEVLSMPLWGLLLIVFGFLWLCIWQRPWRKLGLILIVFGLLSMLTVKKPDVLYDQSGKTVAVADNTGNLVIMPGRGNKWIKQIWLEKTLSMPIEKAEQKDLNNIFNGEKTDPDWLALLCDAKRCVYKERFLWNKSGRIEIDGQRRIPAQDAGAAVYLTPAGKAKIQTVRDCVGYRHWNR